MELGIFLILSAGWLVAIAFFRAYRIWLIYYTLGAVGLALILVHVTQSLTPGFLVYETATSYVAHYLAELAGLPTRIFEAAPDTILVLVIAQEIGWTALQVGIESSGLLETTILIGLIAFYPGWPRTRKTVFIIVGVLVTFLANICRLLIIILMLHYLGKDWLLIAHTLVGKVVFFVLAIAIYWYLLTLPTIRDLGRKASLRSS